MVWGGCGERLMAKQGSKLTPELREKVLAAYHAAPNISTIAKTFALSKSTVHGIVKRQVVREIPTVPEIDQTMALPPLETMDADGVREGSWPIVGAIQLQAKVLLQHNQVALAAGHLDRSKELIRMLKDMAIPYGVGVDKARLLNDQPTEIWESVKEMTTLPLDVTQDDLVQILKASIHGRKALPAAAETIPKPVQKAQRPPKATLYVAPA